MNSEGHFSPKELMLNFNLNNERNVTLFSLDSQHALY